MILRIIISSWWSTTKSLFSLLLILGPTIFVPIYIFTNMAITVKTKVKFYFKHAEVIDALVIYTFWTWKFLIRRFAHSYINCLWTISYMPGIVLGAGE